MVFKPFLALAGTGILLVLAAWASPEGRRLEVWRAARGRAALALPSGPPALAAGLLGIALGIPLALGLIPGSVFALLAAWVASMVARGLLAPEGFGGSRFLASTGWFVVAAWCILAGVLRFGTVDLGAALAAQAVLGPAPLTGPLKLIGASTLAGVVGLLAGAMWVESLPRLSGSREREGLDVVWRWGETALAGAGVAAPLWGPSLGAILPGSLDPAGAVGVGTSFLVTALSVAGVAAIRRSAHRIPVAAALPAAASAALVALAAAGIR